MADAKELGAEGGLVGELESYLRQLAAVMASAGPDSEPTAQAAALAEAQRVTAWGLRAAVRLGRERGLSWRELAEVLDVPASTLHRQYRAGAAIITTQDTPPQPRLSWPAGGAAQVVKDERPAAAAEIGAGSPPVSGVPPALDLFVGRERELADVQENLWQRRMVTLVGPAGVGKTRLASEVARRDAAAYPGGVWWVELASVSDADLTWSAIGAAIGSAGSRDLHQALSDAGKSGAMLLVLDNCEHLVGGVARLVAELCGAHPRLRVLATSRETLRAPGETIVPVGPLRRVKARGSARAADAVRLFIDRAVGVTPALATDEWVAVVAEICDRLDGLPLAIELAAQQIGVFTPEVLLQRLGERLDLLIGGPRGVADRQRSLRGAIQWSFELLDATEQAVFVRLAVLPGGFDQHTAAAVAGDLGLSRAQLWGLLADLTRKSLIIPDGYGNGRFRMLESLRAFGREELEARGDLAATQLRLMTWLADQHGRFSASPWGSELTELMGRITAEFHNIRYALEVAEVTAPHLYPSLGLLLVRALGARRDLAELRQVLEGVVSRATSPALQAEALAYLAAAATRAGNHQAGIRQASQAVAMARALEDEHLLSMALGAQMVAHGLAGDLPPVIVMSTERAALLRRAGRAAELGMVLNNLAWLLVASGDAAAAHAAICESLALYDEQADRTQPLHLRFANDSGMNLLHTAAVVAMVRGDDDTAREYFTAVLTAPFHDHDTIVGAVEGLAIIAARHGEHERALRLLSGATTANHKIDPFWAGQLAAATGAAEEAVGPAVASAAAAQGSALTVEQLIKQALHGPQAADENLRGGLTPREYQVAQLVARGLTNAQIAAALSMSERTVVSHLRNVRAKVGLGTRVEIAMWFTARQA